MAKSSAAKKKPSASLKKPGKILKVAAKNPAKLSKPAVVSKSASHTGSKSKVKISPSSHSTQATKSAATPKVGTLARSSQSAKAPTREANIDKKPEKLTLTKADFEYFRKLLIEKKREILGDVGSMENEAFKGGSNLSNMPIHMADVGTDAFEQEFTLGLIESERQTLREIQEALQRIDDGTYGICLATSKPIGRTRLEAAPWAKYSIEYTRMLEQGLIRHDQDSQDDDEEPAAATEEEEE